MCCYNQVVVVSRTFSTETIESVPAMGVVVKRLMLYVNSDFLTKFNCTDIIAVLQLLENSTAVLQHIMVLWLLKRKQ